MTTILVVAATALALATVLGFLSRYYWMFDLLVHLRAQYAQIAIVIAICALVQGEPVALALAASAFVINVAVVARHLASRSPAPRRSSDDGVVRVFFANALESNHRFDMLTRAVAASRPDVIVLVEVDADAMAQMRLRLAEYPFAEQLDVGTRPWGIGLLSRTIPAYSRTQDLGEAGSPLIVARFDGERPLTIIGAHPTPPYRPRWFALRNDYLAKLALVIREESAWGDVVVVGDFNITPWASHYRSFLENSGLRSAREGFGWNATWPSFLPPFARIPIDHVFIAPRLRVVGFTVGEPIGSDHLPLTIDVTRAEG